MKQAYRTLPGKVVTYVALLLSALLLAGTTLAIAFLVDDGRVFTYTEEALENEWLSGQLQHSVWMILNAKLHNEFVDSQTEEAYQFAIIDGDDNILLESTEAQAIQAWDYHYSAFIKRDGSGNVEDFSFYPLGEGEYEKVNIVISTFPGSPTGNRFKLEAKLIHLVYTMRYAVFAVALLALAATVALCVLLLCACARRPHDDGVYPGPLNRVPFDLLVLLYLVALLGGVVMLYDAEYVFGGILLAVLFLLLPGLLMSLAARVKEHTLWKNTILYRLAKLLQKVGRGAVRLTKSLPLIWKTAVGLAIVSAVELITLLLIVVNTMWREEIVYLWLIEKAVLVPIVLYIALTLRKLQAGGRALAGGDLSYRVDTDRMIGDFKDHGENLNSISRGIAIAVEDRLKSERMKTELITNVSHDIKTPVTSILNYAALIREKADDSEAVEEYAQVLVRQSEKLKRLVEDLIEVSKAATGNLDVALIPCDASLFLNQASGEYEKKLREAGLTLVVKQPEEEIRILADGRRMWRIFDNLMNNICKYALPGTRAYLTLEKEGDEAVITFKNTSKEPLDMTEEELIERFTRGDASRNTEGNGLGLSIVKSITELQNGDMRIVTDGDLFKVRLSFPIV